MPKRQTLNPEREVLQDTLYLLALHALEGSSVVTFAADLIERCKEAGTQADHDAISTLREALYKQGLPISALEIALMEGGLA